MEYLKLVFDFRYSSTPGALDRCMILIILLAIFIPLIVIFASPVVYNTLFLVDTLFQLEVGWRILNGAVAAVDFNDFYGEIVGQYIAWAFGLFGVSVKALDYATLMLFGSTAIAAAAICFRRVGWLSLWILLLLIAALILSRMPLEMGQSVTEITSANAFIYNRFATALALIVMVFVLVPSNDPVADALGAIVTGALLVVMALTKPTFVIFLPFALLALIVQGRYRAALFCVSGSVAAMLLIDPMAQKFLGSLRYAVARSDEVNGVVGLFKKGIKLLLALPVEVAACGAALFLFVRDDLRRYWASAAAAALLVAGGVGMATTMSGVYVIGQQVLPFLAVLPLAFFERSARDKAAAAPQLKMLMLILAGAFALPHLANTVAAGAEGWRNRDLVLFDNGPMRDFVTLNDKFPLRQLMASGLSEDGGLATEVAARLQVGVQWNEGMKYVALADGVAALNRFPDIEKLGVVANSEFSFDFAVGAPPVLGYPVWQGTVSSTPEFADDVPLASATDLVLLLRYDADDSILIDKMDDAFVLCQQTELWNIYARISSDVQGCVK
jgi:hypothetical protein